MTVFANAPAASSAIASDQVRAAYLKATGRGPAEDAEPAPANNQRDVVGDDCPICFEEMTQADVDGKKLSFDTDGCGNGTSFQT